MGGVRCGKKTIDNYAALGAEAEAMAAANIDSFLTQEAKALATAATASCMAYYFIDEALSVNLAEYKDEIQAALDESYRSCMYATMLREERDSHRKNKKFGKHADAEALALECRRIRDEMTGVFRKMAEDELEEEGYTVQRVPAGGQ